VEFGEVFVLVNKEQQLEQQPIAVGFEEMIPNDHDVFFDFNPKLPISTKKNRLESDCFRESNKE